MGEFLGTVAGGGMVALVIVLLCTFLGQSGLIAPERIRAMKGSAGATLGAACVYLLVGAVIYGVIFEPLANPLAFNCIFCIPALADMYAALKAPFFRGPLSGLFAYGGHALGAVLFGQYLLGGQALALLLTWGGGWLVLERLTAIFDQRIARDGLMLLYALPGALFLFLPGWLPLAFFLAALGFWLGGRGWKQSSLTYSPVGYSLALAVSGVLSAALLFAVVTRAVG